MTKIRQFNNDEFLPNTFVVDPAGCGCTDCLMGYSTPADQLDARQVNTALGLGFKLIDRRNAQEKEGVLEFFPASMPITTDWVRLIISMKA